MSWNSWPHVLLVYFVWRFWMTLIYLLPKWRWYEPYCFINYDKKFGCWVQKVLSERILEIFLDPHFAKWRWVKSTHPDFIVRLRFLWPFATISNYKNVWRTVQEHVLAVGLFVCLVNTILTEWGLVSSCFRFFSEYGNKNGTCHYLKGYSIASQGKT